MKNLTEGKESRLIFNFALPMIIGGVIQQFYNVVDSIIVGNFIGSGEESTRALSAVGASFPVFYALISLIIGLASGAAVVISQYFGAKDTERVKTGVDTMFIILFASSAIISALGIYFTEDIFEIMQLPPDIMPQASLYLKILLGGLVMAFGYNGIASVLRSLGDSKTPLYFLIISTIVNIGLDLLFVIVFKWGVAGVASATVIAQAVSFIVGLIYINTKHSFLHINLLKLKFDFDLFKKSIKIGLPTGLQQVFVSLGLFAIFGIVNQYGADVIAAYSVAGRIDAFAIIPAINFSQALASFTGQNIGAGKVKRIFQGLKSTMIMSGLFAILITGMVILLSRTLMGLFTDEPEVIRIGSEYLEIVGSFYILFTVMFAFTGVFRGAGDTMVTMLITLMSLWLVRVPLSYYFADLYDERGIWISVPVAWAMGLLFSGIYFAVGRWKKKAVVKKQPDKDIVTENTDA